MKIGSSNDSNAVKAQYSTSNRLNTRISFHDKCSTNKQGFGNWILSNYNFREGMKVLELGCGTGDTWRGHEDIIEKCEKLVLTDLSEGMLETVKENLGERENVEYRIEDIQNLSFADESFDVVIANMMLYHVPDMNKGIAEVRRVLKKGGTFYSATFGENNFPEKLAEWFEMDGESFHPNHLFTLQNGTEKLESSFEEIRTEVYPDSLHITDMEDLVEYLKSLATFKSVMDLPVERIRSILNSHVVDGAIDLPKEYGLFICK
ncbi:MAG: class I SAM-dependent methyltransferase [Lachnospiraceae bacterium]|nr:class I SAM-dependent methyltransferase [Lachnospiraceae bacterium]